MDNNFESDLAQIRQSVKSSDPISVWHKYYLLGNPFPEARGVIQKVCVNQTAVKNAFSDKLGEHYNGQTGGTLFINGDTGAGKTNILKYFEALVDSARTAGYTPDLYPIYICQPGDTFFEVHQQVLNQVEQHLFLNFFERVREVPEEFEQAVEKLAINQPLASAIRYVAQQSLLDMDFDKREVLPKRIENFQRWLSGGKQLSAAAKKEMQVPYDLDSSSVAVKTLSDLVVLIKHLGCTNSLLSFSMNLRKLYRKG